MVGRRPRILCLVKVSFENEREIKILLSLIKGIYKKPTANIIHNSERLKVFFPKIRNKIRMSVLPTSIQDCPGGSHEGS